METPLIGATKIKQDILDAMSYLNDQQYHAERYCVSISQKSTK
ncbi:3656_t:CDS:1, partial [Acaulospora morrowiae]